MQCPSSYFFTKLQPIILGCSEEDAARKSNSVSFELSLKTHLLSRDFRVLKNCHVFFYSTQIQAGFFCSKGQPKTYASKEAFTGWIAVSNVQGRFLFASFTTSNIRFVKTNTIFAFRLFSACIKILIYNIERHEF